MWTIIYKKEFFYKYWIENVKWYSLKFWSPILALDYVFWASDTQNEKTESEPKFLFSWLQVILIWFDLIRLPGFTPLVLDGRDFFTSQEIPLTQDTVLAQTEFEFPSIQRWLAWPIIYQDKWQYVLPSLLVSYVSMLFDILNSKFSWFIIHCISFLHPSLITVCIIVRP